MTFQNRKYDIQTVLLMNYIKGKIPILLIEKENTSEHFLRHSMKPSLI